MTIYTRPDELVFAAGAKPGEVVPFPDILRGWGITFEQTEGKPPMEWMNAGFLRLNEAIRYLMQRGFTEWSATEDYPVGAHVQHGGTSYKALQANTEVEPGTAALVWAETTPAASTTIKGLIEIATATEAKALASALLAITPSTLGAVLSEKGYIATATFAEVDALTEDKGPIYVLRMGGQVYEWSESAYFTGYRSSWCGAWIDGWTPTPLPWQLAARGGIWSESDPKHKRVIARYRESGLVVPVGSWIPKQNMIADIGDGTWKAPDLRDVFKRMDGTDADTANARTLGSWQKGSLQSFDPDVAGPAVSGLHPNTDMSVRAGFGLDPATTGIYPNAQTVFNLAEGSPALVSVAGGVMRPESTAAAPYILV